MARGPIPDKPRDRPTVPVVLALACHYYAKPGNSTGGNLHVVLEDRNLEDEFIADSIERAVEQGDEEGAALARALLAMTRTQRRRLSRQLEAAERARFAADPLAASRV
jgi:hypothetical protein